MEHKHWSCLCKKVISTALGVAMWDFDELALQNALSELPTGMAEAIIVDVSKYDQVEAAVLKTELALGPISQVINSAGIAGPNTVIDEYPLEDWHQILDVNLTGSFHMLRAILHEKTWLWTNCFNSINCG